MFLVQSYTLSVRRPRLGGLFVWRVGETLPTHAPFWNIYLLMYFIFDCVAAAPFSFSRISGLWGKKKVEQVMHFLQRVVERAREATH